MKTAQENRELENKAKEAAKQRLLQRLEIVCEALRALGVEGTKGEVEDKLAEMCFPEEVTTSAAAVQFETPERYVARLALGRAVVCPHLALITFFADIQAAQMVVRHVDRMLEIVLPLLQKHLLDTEKDSAARIEQWNAIR